MADGEIGLFEAIFTQRAIRSLKPDPIPREHIEKIIEAATKAPSGGNSQPWAFIVVQDRAKMAEIAKIAKTGFAGMYEAALARMQPGDPEPMARLKGLIESFEDVPCLIAVCHVSPPGRGGAANLASIFPAVQNLLLAARGLGIGGVLTSGWAAGGADTLRSLLKLPENVEPVAYIPLGYPDKERYGKTTRRPLSEVTHWEAWEGEKENTAKLPYRS